MTGQHQWMKEAKKEIYCVTHHPFTRFSDNHERVFLSTDRRLDLAIFSTVICPPLSTVLHQPSLLSAFSARSVDLLADSLLSSRDTGLITGCVSQWCVAI